MARKPTRFWHPVRRMLLRAQESTRALIARRNDTARLDDIRARLQHYLTAMYGRTIAIDSLTPPKKGPIASESDAERIRLPALLPQTRADISPLEQYRLLAVQHAERMRRATATHARAATTDLERDLFQLAEAASIDALIAMNQPGLRPTLDVARADAIAHRPKHRGRTRIEQRVEEMIRHAWPHHPLDVPLANDAESNADWARRTALQLSAIYGSDAACSYRRVPEITLWQTTITTHVADDESQATKTESPERKSARDPWSSQTGKQSRSGSAMPGAAQSSVSQNKGGRTAVESQGSNATSRIDAEGTAGRAEEREHATEKGVGDSPADGVDDVAGLGASDAMSLPDEILFHYPEWDFHAQSFRARGTIVRVIPALPGSSDWATNALQTHGREVHHAKQQFERLRSHRTRLRRQVQGDELDLEACVEALVDRSMNVAPTDRLYSLVRPGRRELAITLLIDVSKSTGDVVAGEQCVIDIERIAALVATAAFDALGDDYSILAFSSEGASNVRVHTLKAFGEMNSLVVRQRISALTPHGTTRLGAAVRHATAMLSDHPAPHRLLLILSDGKPHDFAYDMDYAVQDSRHAMLNAQLQGIHPFCITVDASQGQTYLAEIFGSASYRVVSKPSQSSQALLLAVKRLIGGSD